VRGLSPCGSARQWRIEIEAIETPALAAPNWELLRRTLLANPVIEDLVPWILHPRAGAAA